MKSFIRGFNSSKRDYGTEATARMMRKKRNR